MASILIDLIRELRSNAAKQQELLDILSGYVIAKEYKQHQGTAQDAADPATDPELLQLQRPANQSEQLQNQEPEEIWALQEDEKKMPTPTESRKLIKKITFRGYRIPIYKIVRKNTFIYYIRYRKEGYNIYVTARTLEELQTRFLEAYKTAEPAPKKSKDNNQIFSVFAEYYCSTFKTEKEVSAATVKYHSWMLKHYILPAFGDRKISTITPGEIKTFLDGIQEQGHDKTAKEVRIILNLIFKAAVAHGLIKLNPIDMVPTISYEQKHGHALTRSEERYLLDSIQDPMKTMYAVMLYTGQRTNELAFCRKEGQWIITKNSKQKDKKYHEKKIPISPMLQPFLQGVPDGKIEMKNAWSLQEKFKKILPNHKLYDLRTTFYSRCQEIGIPDPARSIFMGHTLPGLQKNYTDVSDEYLLQQGAKIQYDLPDSETAARDVAAMKKQGQDPPKKF